MKLIKNILMMAVTLSLSSSMKAEERGGTGNNLCPDPGFTTWKCPAGYRLAPGEGMNGNTALLNERTDPKSYVLMSQPITGLEKNTPYNFGVWVKCENVLNEGLGATVCVEFMYKNKVLPSGDIYQPRGGSYPRGIAGTRGWTLINDTFTTPTEFDSAYFVLYLRQGQIGKAWFCAPYLNKKGLEWRVGLLSPVMNQAITAGQQELIFNSYTFNEILPDSLQVKIESVRTGKTERLATVPVKHNRFAVSTCLTPGNYPLKLTLMNGDKTIVVTEIPIQVLDPASKVPPNATRIDAKGRSWVNGKKFLPVGIYTNQWDDVFKTWNHCWRKTILKILNAVRSIASCLTMGCSLGLKAPS
jgi:hypothetical protein